MIKQRLKLKVAMLIIIICSMALSLFSSSLASTNESYEYTYAGIAQNGDNDTSLMKIKKADGTEYKVYCIDFDVYAKNSEKYSLVNLEDGSYYNTENANKIRNIIISSYPYISLGDLKKLSGIKNLTESQAIAATQEAIWHYSNSTASDKIKGNVKTLYDWYLQLPARNIETAKVANIDISQEIIATGDNKYEVNILFKANQKNVDETNVDLKYSFDKDLESTYGAQIENLGTNADGFTNVKISNLSKNASFKINVEGTQTLALNAYFYSPESGRENAQSLVGVRNDKTAISASKEINLAEGGYDLTINKIDAKELTGISGAKFKIASNKSLTENVKIVTTESNRKSYCKWTNNWNVVFKRNTISKWLHTKQ